MTGGWGKAISTILAVLVLVLCLGGCSRESAPALRIGTNVWIGSEPLYLARELGHLAPQAVRLVEYPSASEVLRAYRNQALDGMVISLDEVLVLASDELKPKIVSVVDVSRGADVVVARGGLRTMKDLKGKRVAVETKPGRRVIRRWWDVKGFHWSCCSPMLKNPSRFAVTAATIG